VEKQSKQKLLVELLTKTRLGLCFQEKERRQAHSKAADAKAHGLEASGRQKDRLEG
jgi:hypothetical protein